MIIWGINTACNLILCLWLLFRGHATRYQILFVSLVYETFMAVFLFYTYKHYGSASSLYAIAYEFKKCGSMTFNFGIIFESWRWSNKKVRIPIELYLGVQLAGFVFKKAGFEFGGWLIHEILRYAILAIALWFFYIFREAPKYLTEKRYE
jgi:hypothetical protein